MESKQQFEIVQSQIAAREREKKLIALTVKELDDMPGYTRVFKGVGRM